MEAEQKPALRGNFPGSGKSKGPDAISLSSAEEMLPGAAGRAGKSGQEGGGHGATRRAARSVLPNRSPGLPGAG